jgi:predicted TIM-barrel fold metal-dependent hydrolase
MDLDGVLGSVSFPSFPRFSGQLFSIDGQDKELALACIAGYNDWMVEAWAGAAPGRLIPLCLIPLWDPALAVAEMTRAAEKGARAICFSENPSYLGLPSIHDKDGYWEPVFSAAEDLDLPLCMHIGSSSRGIGPTAPDAPESISVGLAPFSCMPALMDWLLSGVLLRHPGLKIVLSEGGIGWIPYVLERTDYTWEHQGAWTHTPIKEPPSHYFKHHFYGCFIDDKHGVHCLDEIGPDNVMMESDYPHSDSTWPNTIKVAKEMLEGVDAATVRKLTTDNAKRVFRFEPSGIGRR